MITEKIGYVVGNIIEFISAIWEFIWGVLTEDIEILVSESVEWLIERIKSMKAMKKILCKLSIHRPLLKHTFCLTDKISGKVVYDAVCPCNKRWMVDSLNPFGGFSIRKARSHETKKTIKKDS